MISAYKVRNADGLFARAAFHGWSERGKTWSTKGGLNCAFTHWKESVRFLNPATQKYEFSTNGLGRQLTFVHKLPEDWVVVELTEKGLREIPAQEFYGR